MRTFGNPWTLVNRRHGFFATTLAMLALFFISAYFTPHSVNLLFPVYPLTAASPGVRSALLRFVAGLVWPPLFILPLDVRQLLEDLLSLLLYRHWFCFL